MLRLALVLSLGHAAADCTSEAFAGLSDPGFSWLVSGTNADRKGNVTAICASATNDARTHFNTRLNSITAACIPPGQEASSAFGLTVNLLNSLLCEQKESDFCLLSLLPLFDFAYFTSLAGGSGSYLAPPLRPVSDSADRMASLCGSGLCNAYIENSASALLFQLPRSNDTSASDFIRSVVKSMRCACAVRETPCYNTTMTNELIVEASGVKTLVDAKSCDAAGVLKACPRTWVNCEAVAPPACGKPCSGGILANINFRVKNLDWACLKAQLTDNALRTIRADVIANVPGLLDTDFGCDCSASLAPATGTECNCTVKCVPLAAVLNVNLTAALASLKRNAAALVIPTPTLDAHVEGCQVSSSLVSFGSSFEVISIHTNFPIPPTPAKTDEEASASPTLSLSLSVLALCVSLVL